MFAFWLGPAAAQTEKRVALVIGNATYQHTPTLGNPVNDAEDLAAALEKVGFTVQVVRNVSKRELEAALIRFARLADNADAAMVFYAGHGVQFRGANYLMPVDARLEDEISINYELVRVDDVVFSLERARGVKLLVLDACRNNPLVEQLVRRGQTRDTMLTRGLARIDPSRGMIVAYSTQPNQVAVDGTGRNSPFAGALIKYIAEPGLEVGSLFRRVAIEVDRVTGGRQLPELWVTLRGEFYLNNRETDVQAWARISTSNDAGELAEFIRNYPGSVLAGEVRRRIDVIERSRAENAQIERERLAREQTERDRLAREQAERTERQLRDQLAREQTAREQAERIAREAAAREQAERERILREQIERERLAREQSERLERERLAAAQAAREQAERKAQEQAQKEQAQREQAAAAPPASQQIAMLPPASATASPAAPPPALVRDIKSELKRVGCLAGAVDDKWATADTQASVAKFVRLARLQVMPEQPSIEFLDSIRRSISRVCPLECGARQVERNGHCVAKTCPPGQLMRSDGQCEERRSRSKLAARTRVTDTPAEPRARPMRNGAESTPPPGASKPRGGGEAVVCGRGGCRSGTWSPTRIPGAHCHRAFNNRDKFFCGG